MPIEAEQVRKDLDRRRRAFIGKLRADLIWLGCDPAVVNRMRTAELMATRAQRVRQLMDAPTGARWDG